jgi:type II secretory pathway pseudopilin PulG
MKTFIIILSACLLSGLNMSASGSGVAPANSLTVREIHYEGKLSDTEALFTLNLDAEATGESSLPLLEGDVAVLPSKLPVALKIVREGNRYFLIATRSGHFKLQFDVVAKIEHTEPWNRISFTGPAATIASVAAQAAGTDTEVQLLNGTLLTTEKTNGVERTTGFLGADQTVALRWQAKVAEVVHKAMLAVDSTITAQITPTVIKYTNKFHYEVVQGSTAELTLTLPAAQALTHLDGEQIRDWHLAVDGNLQTLTVELIKPIENAYDLTLYSEQAVENTGARSSLDPPQPLNVEHESGVLTISAQDMLAELDAPANLNQVNAPDNAIAAYQFNARPLTLALTLKPVEPEISVTDRVAAQLEEARLVIRHQLTLDVEKAGIYTLDLIPQTGFAIADVQGDGLEDWNVTDGKIRVNFSARVLGLHQVTVQLEQALKHFPDKISLLPLRVAGAEKEGAQIGAAAMPGIQLRTGGLSGLHEIPINRLPNRSNEILAYTAEQADWNLSIACEKLAARAVADVFNLVTIGDGDVGGSAIIRYGLANQGVQEFKVHVPANFKNVEFTGSNIRRTEQADDVWTIGLQDKAWDGYTLVVTYDQPFDPKGTTLSVGGIHALNVERETGSIAVTTAASLQLSPKAASHLLQRVDETELSAADRAFITRAVVLAYQYTGGEYDLSVDVKQYAEVPVLEAVADRTQITSVLTGDGEMLTQASFMVKNNAKQFQRFELPQNSRLWGCYVNGQPAKPERDGDGVLVSLPHEADRDQAFTVDITYAQTNGSLASTFGKSLALSAPRTDVPNTYAEWQLFVPPAFRLSDFGGSMNVAQGTTYELLDAWEKFLAFYGQVLHEAGGAILIIGLLAFLVIALVISAARRGWNGVITLFAVMMILAVLGAMLLPALSAAKRKAQRISSVNNLKEIGLAAKIFSGDNNGRLPQSFGEMKDELGTDRITYDVETGQPFTYLGGGMPLDSLKPDSVLAYSPIFNGHCEVLYADGSVEQMTGEGFAELSQRGLVQLAAPLEVSERQREVISTKSEFKNPAEQPPPMAAPSSAAANGLVGLPSTPPEMEVTTALAMEDSAHGPAGFGGQAASASPPTTAGIRSIRIDLPESGQPFLFTKVLNIRDEPLSIRTRIMPLHTFQMIQMAWQTVAFLIGLLLWWRQWQRAHRNSFMLAVALALIFGSVCSLLVQWRALHDLLIIGFPVVTLAIIAMVIWKYWPRSEKIPAKEAAPVSEPSAPETGMPPVAAAVVLLLALGFSTAHAADATLANGLSAATTPSIVSANYSGTANDQVASVNATLQFASAQAGQIVPLFGDDVAVEQFSVQNGQAELVRDGSNLAVKLGRGKVILEIKMLVKIAGDVTKRQLLFGIPPALSSRASFALAESGAEVDFPTAVSFQRILEKDRTQVEAVMGSADHVELLWTPRVKRAEEIAATIFCQNAALVSLGSGVMDIRATMDYQISQGEMRQARVLLPAGQRLLRVEGDGIRTWEIKNENTAQVLVVDLAQGISSTWRLVIETGKNLEALPATLNITVPHALEVKRETGLIALRGSDELGLTVESADGLQRVDAGEFAQAVAEKTDGLSSVFQFSRPEFSLRARIEAIQPEIEAVAQNNFLVGAGQVSLSTTIDYTIKRTGVFALKAALPEGYRLDQVTGDNIQQQNERDENGERILEVTLKDRTSGAYTLRLELTRDFKQLPASLTIAGVYPLNATKLTGFVAVTAEAGVAVKTGTFDGLTEIPAGSLPDFSNLAANGSVLAYKFISSDPQNSPDWNLSVTTEAVAAWVRAEIVNSLSLTETLASGRALVRYDIANAPVKELRLSVPGNFQNVEITGPNIRSREQEGEVWRVELQSPVRGIYKLTVTWEQPDLPATGTVKITGVTAEGVERETGLLTVSARAPLQVSEASAVNLQPVDTGDFPDWAGNPDTATALAYRYVRPDYQLALAVRRLDEAEVLQAIVESAQLTSVVADDGQMMTEMSLSLRSNGRQFLEVQLPAGASVWSAFVAGQPVRPSLHDGRLLLPIEQSAADDGATPVELTYVDAGVFPRARGNVGFASPRFDVPLKNAHWEIYLPPDYDYKNFQGTMSRELAPALESATASFSLLEYSRMEQESKSADKFELTRDVDEARQELAAGNVREANANLDRAKTKLVADGFVSADLEQVQKDLQSAQASNLVAAQNDFTVRNSSRIGGEASASLPSSSGFQYNSAAAGEQWAKLQQAQEIVTAKVQPLRVNLPVRGLHFVFAQVLQTETGEPMTIQLFASNTKAVSWPLRGLTVLSVFLCLWILVAILCRLTSHSKIHAA